MTLERRYVGETVCARLIGRGAARKRMCVCVKAEGRREAERECKFNTKMLDSSIFVLNLHSLSSIFVLN